MLLELFNFIVDFLPLFTSALSLSLESLKMARVLSLFVQFSSVTQS